MEDPSLQCDECDYTVGDKHGLDLHHCTHLPPESRFQCDQCPKSYSQKWHLKQHQKEHQGRFGPCPHCRATFAQKSGLVAHVPRKEELQRSHFPVKSVDESTAARVN